MTHTLVECRRTHLEANTAGEGAPRHHKHERGIVSDKDTFMDLGAVGRREAFKTRSRELRRHMNRHDKLTPHFSAWEFYSSSDAKHFKDVEPPHNIMINVRHLACQLEVIRSEANKRLVGDGHTIQVGLTRSGGYRTTEHNDRQDGAKRSLHLFGKASDIKLRSLSNNPNGTNYGIHPEVVHKLILDLIKKGKIDQGGVGLYPGFVHYDTRGTAARWDET